MTHDPTERFSDRVADYVRYRPRYPEAVLETLRAECGLTGDWVVADIGSGTGILTELFLKNGNRVFGVEPNAEMRRAGERQLAGYPEFRSVDARAEDTGLEDAAVDLVAAGQAFHWFDRSRARAEFGRILKPGGWTALVWNERKLGGTPFLEAYEALLRRFGTDYATVNQRQTDEAVRREFFGGEGPRRAVFDNRQDFDLEGLRGRLLSSSYTPGPEHPDRAPMLAELERLFRAHQSGGRVRVEYETTLTYGRLDLGELRPR